MGLFIDAHCHPTLKHYLYGYSMFRESFGRKDNNYTNIQVTEPAMQRGEVDAVLTAHYLPEKFIEHDWRLVDSALPLFKLFFHQYLLKIEKVDAFQQTINMIDDFEKLFIGNSSACIAHSFSELTKALQEQKKVFIHTLEGGHHLGRGKNKDDYLANIELLKSKGVAMLTLSHFYPNDITFPTEGITPHTKKLLGMQFAPPSGAPLSETGEVIVAKLLQEGILVDLTHTNPVARKRVYDINGGQRPLLFSHVGVRNCFNDQQNPSFALMTPDDNEILEIKKCKGVIGVIFMNYWLSGKEEGFLNEKDFGLANILDTIKHIASITGNFENIAIGTDFDGMSDPPDDFYDCTMLKNFKDQLFANKSYLAASDDDIEKILGKNMLRILEAGWQ